MKLVYLPLRGLGDLSQFALEVYETPYEMLAVSMVDMQELKPMLPFGRLPVALVSTPSAINGKLLLAQSGAILRAIASPHHDEDTLALADMW